MVVPVVHPEVVEPEPLRQPVKHVPLRDLAAGCVLGRPGLKRAQFGEREGCQCAQNIVRLIRGEPTRPFHFKPLGAACGIGGRQGVADGSVTETFACGTAAVITPVGEVKARTGDFTVGDGTPGPLTMRLRESLLDIQHGRVADTRGWLHRVA